MNYNKALALVLLLSMTISACYYDVEEEIYPSTECDTIDVTYSVDVVNILKNNCYVCHDQATNEGNVTLEGYDRLKTYATNGKLLGVIKHLPGFPEMPQNAPQLPECNIAKIEQWVNDGALNN